MVKIGIGLPTFGTIKSKTAYGIIEIVRQNPDIEFFPIFSYGNFAFENKEKIIEIAEDNLCSHLLFMDGDMAFESDILKKLLAHDKDIVEVLYNFRKLPLQTTAKFFGTNGQT